MEDGSAPGRSIGIERFCNDNGAQRVSQTDKKGQFLWVQEIDPLSDRACVLRASFVGYDSTVIDISAFNWSTDPNLPPLVLRRRETGSADQSADIFLEDRIPLAARTAWNNAQKLAQKKNWRGVERELRAAVQAAPRFGQGWYALGLACWNQHEPAEARDALLRAVDLNPRSQQAYLLLARASIAAEDWSTAEKAADGLIREDTKQRYPEIYLDQATARYYLKDLDRAEASAREAIRLDRRGEFPRAEYTLGVILQAKGDNTGAREHISRYLELEPKAADAATVRAQLESVGKPAAAQPALKVELASAGSSDGLEEAWVPGGMKALAAVAHLSEPPTYSNFFPGYCAAILREVSIGTSSDAPQFIPRLRAYLAAISELSQLGERRDGDTLIRLSLSSEELGKTGRVLRSLGWKVTQTDSSISVEPGDQPEDGLRQAIPAVLGIDELDMKQALEAGRGFQFEIPSENARLAGGEDWSTLLKDAPVPPGGLAAAFATDWRLTKTCAGLGAMSGDAADALLRSIGLRALATRYADPLARHGEAFALSQGAATVPGGAEAAPVWEKLAGQSPRNPPAFFRALLDKPIGTLVAFYSVLARADPAHQQYFTKTPQRAERFYAWYRQGEEFRYGLARQMEGWRSEFLQKAPLDDAGNVRFPGGRAAWTALSGSDDEVLPRLESLEALVPIAQLEARRGEPFDQGSVQLLVQHYSEWRPLFPYFEKLTKLSREDFSALARLADAAAKYPPARQNAVLGEWYSLVELIARGAAAGSLDAQTSARAFRRVCEDLLKPGHSAAAAQIVRDLAGAGTSLDESVAAGLLRLTGERRAAFDRVLQLQKVPPLDSADASPDSARAATALAGLVYAASLDSSLLLLNEDPQLLSRHQFTARDQKGPLVFSQGVLIRAQNSSGSRFSGGLMNLAELGRGLARGSTTLSGDAAPENGTALRAAGSSPGAAPLPSVEDVAFQPDFRADGRLVEVHATITDGRGRYVDNLTVDNFTILDQHSLQKIAAFEPQSNEVSCVLVLDTTGSMQLALPALKNAALKLIGALRPEDRVAVYSFSDTVTELQALTTDKTAAMRAVLRTQAQGNTALYDALAHVSRVLSGHPGKKVIVLFSDGQDNVSTLVPETAIQRAKAAGVPVYTIAQGEAVGQPKLLEQLAGIAGATGGVSFVIEKPSEIGRVFEKVSEELTHGYLLSFQPPSIEDHAWRSLEVVVQGPKNLKVRAREGYYPQ